MDKKLFNLVILFNELFTSLSKPICGYFSFFCPSKIFWISLLMLSIYCQSPPSDDDAATDHHCVPSDGDADDFHWALSKPLTPDFNHSKN